MEQNKNPRTIVAVKFSWNKDGKTYDYFADFPVEISQRIYVPTKRGEEKVEVMAIKDKSELASVAALRPVEDLRTEDEKVAKYSNGQRKFSEDRTMLDENGNRSIFDDVDR